MLELFITEAAAARHTTLVRAAFAAGIEVTQVTEKAAAALSDAVTPQGLVVRCAHAADHRRRCAGRLAEAGGGAGARPTIPATPAP